MTSKTRCRSSRSVNCKCVCGGGVIILLVTTLVFAGTRHVTSCPGLVVSQDCEEVGLDTEGLEYCRQYSQQLSIQARGDTTPVTIGQDTASHCEYI
jgi:hypothetical protein